MSNVPEPINIVGPEAIRDPQTFFGRLRNSNPIVWDETYRSWLVTSYRHVSTLVRDPRLSSDRINPFIRSKLSGAGVDPLVRQAFDVLSGWMVFQDDPGHARLRVLVNKGFTAKSVSLLRARCATLIEELLDGLPADGELDLMEKVIAPFPSVIIAERLGVPVEDREQFEDWTRKVAPLVSGALDDPRRYAGVAEGMDALVHYFRSLMQRYSENPAENLITDLLRAREADDSLSEAELIATCTLILFGGHETTANFIANALVALQRNPSQWAALRDGTVDSAAAIEELLRFDGPAKALTRVVREGFSYEGIDFDAGDRVFLSCPQPTATLISSPIQTPCDWTDPTAAAISALAMGPTFAWVRNSRDWKPALRFQRS